MRGEGGLGPVVPARDRGDDGLHEDDPGDGVGMAAGPVEAEPAAPVVQDEDHGVADAERLPRRVEVAGVLGEGIAHRAGVGQLDTRKNPWM
jgi:hypothetical protein